MKERREGRRREENRFPIKAALFTGHLQLECGFGEQNTMKEYSYCLSSEVINDEITTHALVSGYTVSSTSL